MISHWKFRLCYSSQHYLNVHVDYTYRTYCRLGILNLNTKNLKCCKNPKLLKTEEINQNVPHTKHVANITNDSSEEHQQTGMWRVYKYSHAPHRCFHQWGTTYGLSHKIRLPTDILVCLSIIYDVCTTTKLSIDTFLRKHSTVKLHMSVFGEADCYN